MKTKVQIEKYLHLVLLGQVRTKHLFILISLKLRKMDKLFRKNARFQLQSISNWKVSE
jgi:hypothetical protein